MDQGPALTVGAIARLSGVTVRTLHHYDAIGLVVPGERTAAGYRRYRRADVERLQEVLFFRELGFSLEQIKEIVGRPTYYRAAALKATGPFWSARRPVCAPCSPRWMPPSKRRSEEPS